MKKSRSVELWVALGFGLVFALLRLGGFRPIEILELRALDYRMAQSDRSDRTGEVAIVAVDNASIEKYGRWPWPRSLVAELIEKISAYQPAIIGTDSVWSEASTECDTAVVGPELSPACRSELVQALGDGHSGDDRLAAAIGASRRTVLGYFFDLQRKGEGVRYEGEGKYALVRSEDQGAGEARLNPTSVITRNLPAINAAALSRGYFNFIPDMDGLYRRVPMAFRFAHLRGGGEGEAEGSNAPGELATDMVTPLSLAMLAAHQPSRMLAINFSPFGVSGVQFGKTSIPVDEDGLLLINYRGKKGTFETYSAESVLAGGIPDGALRDKYVLLGVTATAVGDIRAMPFDGTFPGVEIHANVLDNILRQDFVFQAAPRGIRLGNPASILNSLTPAALADVALILFGALLLALLLRWVRGVRGALAAVLVLALFAGASQILFIETGIALRVVYATFALVLTYLTVGVLHYVAAERETRETRRVLDLYLSPSVSREISAHPEMLNLGGEKRERTVLFSDVKSFTSISERLSPEDLVELLNLYLGEMTDIVFANNGMLDKYIGDGLMAVWGAPLPQVDHAVLTCRAALGMVEKLGGVNEHGASRGWPPLEIRIGINSGQMVFGNMGSASHLSLTVMGDNVNLAARLEGTNKTYGSTIIATEATVAAAGDGFLWRELDWVRVRGKTQGVQIFELLGTADQRPQWEATLTVFEAGLAAFRQQHWQEAADAFSQILVQRAKDGPSSFYLKRCRQYLEQPPGPEWEAISSFSD